MALSPLVVEVGAEVRGCVCVCVCERERKRHKKQSEIVLMHTLYMPVFVCVLTFHSPGISDMPAGLICLLPSYHPSLHPSLRRPPGDA